MAFLDNQTPIKIIPSLDIFRVPATSLSLKNAFYQEVLPMNPITSDGPYEFRIPSDHYMIDPSKSFIYTSFKLVRKDGSNIPADNSLAAGINLLGATFFKQAKLYLNGRLVCDSGDKYAYRAFFERELGSTSNESTTRDALMGYVDDGGIRDYDSGIIFGPDKYSNSKEVEFIAPIFLDLFMQDRYLVNYLDIRLEFHRNSDAFAIQTVSKSVLPDPTKELEKIKDYKLIPIQMKVLIKKVEPLDNILMEIEKNLSTVTAKYPIRRVVMTNLHIPKASRSSPVNTLFSGQLPRRIFFTFVESDAFHGKRNLSPFNFKPYGVSDIKVLWGGERFPAYPLRLDFSNGQYALAVHQLFDALGTYDSNVPANISPSNLINNQAYFGFSFVPDNSIDSWYLIKEGSVSLEVSFSEALPESGLEVIVYAEFDNLILINGQRNASTYY